MPIVASAPAAKARTAVPAMKTSMPGATAQATAPTTVIPVKTIIKPPTR